MKDRSCLEEAVMNISSRFINLEFHEVDEGIHEALQSVGETIGADHGYVYLVSNDLATLTRTHEWFSEGRKLPMGRPTGLPMEQFPWMKEKIKRDQIVHILQMDDLPPEANAEKELLQSNGCESLILVLMVLEKSFVGFLGFDSGRPEKTWPNEIIGPLKMVGEIFSNVLARRRMEEGLKKIEEKYRNLVENINLAAVLLDRAEAKYHGIFANAVEGIFQCTLDGRFIVSNPACAGILGYGSPEELIIQDSAGQRPHFVDPERYKELQRLLKENNFVKGFETEVFRKDGSKIWISVNALAMQDANGAVVFYEGTMVDITGRKWADDQIRYLSFHDKLTGLYNRAYFEEELKRLDTDRELPITVIMGDLNGLKLVNDAFGHREGDKLLIQVAKILKESFRKEDVIARWGGDEFAVFLRRTNYSVAMEIIERIRLVCRQASQDPVKVSIALGAVTKEDPSEDLQDILKEAEERMYRSKLLESKFTRDSILSSLRRTLFEKSHESEEHTYRLQELALSIGRALGLPDGQIDDLELLATLHDIGKIGVPQEVIIKQGHLSPEEWELIRKHPEIGYRIAKSSLELAPIAEAILAHHEWWDGGGYPRGLKGEEIPLISRIIAMVDAYDVMTHAQPYKEAMSQKEALQELQKKAGSQFDPKLTARFIEMVCAA